MYQPSTRPTTTPTEPRLLTPGPTQDQLSELVEDGFVQISEAPLPPVDEPFPIRVSVPLLVRDGHPFYLHLIDEMGTFEMLVADDDVVDTLLFEMMGYTPFDDCMGYPQAFFWAEMLDDGSMNFDTKTPCPEFNF